MSILPELVRIANVPLDPRYYAINDVYTWRQFLKRELLTKRHWRSDLSGKKLTSCHMHEGIVTRATVPKSVKWHLLIFSEYNSFLLLPDEHSPMPPQRDWAIARAYALYGRDTVREWFYEQLPWKVIPFQLP